MLLDHIGASLMRAYYHSHHAYTPSQQLLYDLLRDIGRIAFPIYIFLLVEGLRHTRNATRYFLRLCLFALISEIPFDLAFYRVWYYPTAQNVFFTLAIGFFLIWGIRSMSAHIARLAPKKTLPQRLYLACLSFGLIIAGLLGAYLLCTDYSYVGVLAIVAAYLLRHYPIPQALCVCLILLLSSPREWYSLLSVPPILYYNGTRGRQPRLFFYLYYPVHLLLLYLVLVLTGLSG